MSDLDGEFYALQVLFVAILFKINETLFRKT